MPHVDHMTPTPVHLQVRYTAVARHIPVLNITERKKTVDIFLQRQTKTYETLHEFCITYRVRIYVDYKPTTFLHKIYTLRNTLIIGYIYFRKIISLEYSITLRDNTSNSVVKSKRKPLYYI